MKSSHHNILRIVRIAAEKIIFWGILLNVILLNGALVYPNAFAHSSFLTKIIKNESSFITKKMNVLGESTTDTTSQEQLRRHLRTDLAYWQSVIRANPSYRDGYYQLTVLSFQLNDLPAARTYLAEMTHLSPNYPGLIKLEDLLNTQTR